MDKDKEITVYLVDGDFVVMMGHTFDVYPEGIYHRPGQMKLVLYPWSQIKRVDQYQ